MRAYQGDIAKFEETDAQVLGVSVDSPERNRKFAQEIGATFPLLSDTEKTVTKQYGVLMMILRMASRATFVIDKDGIIRHIDEGSAALDPTSAHQACSLLEHRKQ